MESRAKNKLTSINVSSPVRSPQNGIHPRLLQLVRRYKASEYFRPLNSHVQKQVQELHALVTEYNRRVVLDNGCGTGMSTVILSERYPDCAVIGVDKSAHRLARAQSGSNANLRFLRADLIDYLRAVSRLNWEIVAQYYLYPNPWPKSVQVQRRWHAHPVFRTIMHLGGDIELRTNWEIYAREFVLALRMYGIVSQCEELSTMPNESISLFERKYAASGHSLYRVRGCVAL